MSKNSCFPHTDGFWTDFISHSFKSWNLLFVSCQRCLEASEAQFNMSFFFKDTLQSWLCFFFWFHRPLFSCGWSVFWAPFKRKMPFSHLFFLTSLKVRSRKWKSEVWGSEAHTRLYLRPVWFQSDFTDMLDHSWSINGLNTKSWRRLQALFPISAVFSLLSVTLRDTPGVPESTWRLPQDVEGARWGGESLGFHGDGERMGDVEEDDWGDLLGKGLKGRKQGNIIMLLW